MGAWRSRRVRPSVIGVGSAEESGSLEGTPLGAAFDAFGAVMAGLKRDQDRFCVAPRLSKDSGMLGVFDGHGEGQLGNAAAERAASGVPALVAQHGGSVAAAFAAFQAERARAYEKDVLAPVRALKAKTEKETGVEIAMIRPQEGGCTATVLLAEGGGEGGVRVAWCGDSRAVLCRRSAASASGGGGVEAVDLTEDHGVDNEREAARATGAGGTVCGQYISVDGADGYIQLLRSLGDVAFHEGGVVLAEPEERRCELGEDDLFVIVASDGLWGPVSSAEAVECAFGVLQAGHGPEQLVAACKALQALAVRQAAEKQQGKDDIGVVVASVAGARWG